MRSAATLETLVGLVKSIEQVKPRNGSDAAFLQMVSSLKLEQHNDRAVLTATIPTELLQQLASSTTAVSSNMQQQPAATMSAPGSH
jgi:hypothetical protein